MNKHTSGRSTGLLRDALLIGIAVATAVLACVAGSAFADVGSRGDTQNPWGNGVASHVANFKH